MHRCLQWVSGHNTEEAALTFPGRPKLLQPPVKVRVWALPLPQQQASANYAHPAPTPARPPAPPPVSSLLLLHGPAAAGDPAADQPVRGRWWKGGSWSKPCYSLLHWHQWTGHLSPAGVDNNTNADTNTPVNNFFEKSLENDFAQKMNNNNISR